MKKPTKSLDQVLQEAKETHKDNEGSKFWTALIVLVGLGFVLGIAITA